MKKLNKILLIDDDNITNHLNNTIISRLNIAHEVIMKHNGNEALSFLKEDCKSPDKYPDLIFLDLRMPAMDGFEFLEEFEKLCKDFRKNIHIVILTTSKSGEDLIKLRELGQYYYVDKPLTSDKVLDIHHRYFREI